MRPTRKLLAVALAATALLAALATNTYARSFELSNQRIRALFTPLVIIASDGSRVSCNVTLEGSYHSRTIAKVPNSLIGYITRADSDILSCRSAPTPDFVFDFQSDTLPGHIFYVDFSGTLPAARPRIQLNGIRYTVRNVPLIGTCQYRGNIRSIFTGPAGGGINEGNANLTLENGLTIRSETAFCPEVRFEGRGPGLLLGTTTPITVRLI